MVRFPTIVELEFENDIAYSFAYSLSHKMDVTPRG
jgi:hypothetical protein